LAERNDAIAARQRKFEEQVVAGGAALADHFNRGDEAIEVFVFERPVAGHAGHGIEEQFERPTIADKTLGERAMAMDVAIDQAGHHRAVGCVHRHCTVGASIPGDPISRTVSPSIRMSAGMAWRCCRSTRRPLRMMVNALVMTFPDDRDFVHAASLGEGASSPAVRESKT
jgi:hypothetical protein